MTTANFTGDTGSAIALSAVLAFVIDRVVSTALFLLSFNHAWSRRCPDPGFQEPGRSKLEAEKKQKLIYLIMAVVLSLLVILSFGRMSLLPALGVEYPQNVPTDPTAAQTVTDTKSPGKRNTTLQNVPARFVILDIFLTTLLLVGGADRMGHLVKMIGGAGSLGTEKPEPQPLLVTGKLTLEENLRKRPPVDSQQQEEASD